jgi:hypothetical protein
LLLEIWTWFLGAFIFSLHFVLLVRTDADKSLGWDVNLKADAPKYFSSGIKILTFFNSIEIIP